MKHLLPFIFAASAFAQVGQHCIWPEKAKPSKMVCQDISVEVMIAARAFVASETIPVTPAKAGDPTTAPKFKGVADLFLSNDVGLFTALLNRFPPADVATAIIQRAVAEALVKTRQDTALAKPVSSADPI